jgi:hypothetical protein
VNDHSGCQAAVIAAVKFGAPAICANPWSATRCTRTPLPGNPARRIRPRFPEAIAARLQALAWWDWPHERLHAALPDFRALSVEAFLDRYEGAPGRLQASAVA